MKPNVVKGDSAQRAPMAKTVSSPLHKVFQAIEAVVYIACHPGTIPVRSKDICAQQKVTLRYLEHMLQRLVHADILKGVRGPKGGYLLASDRRKITLSQIYNAIVDDDGPMDEQESSLLHTVVVMPVEKQMYETLGKTLESITIQDLYEHAKQAGVGNPKTKSGDFTI